MHTFQTLYVFLAILICNLNLQAQEPLQYSLNTSGGQAQGIDGSASFTIGQLNFSYFEDANMHISEGIQQAAVNTETFNVANKGENISISAYPNPVLDHVILSVANMDIQNCEYQLYDIHGRLLATDQLNQAETSINLYYLQPATYFLTVLNDKRTLKTLKIIKS
jgi:hypothetical protein